MTQADPIKNLSIGAITQGTTDELMKIIKIFAVVVLVIGIPAAFFMRWDWLNPAFPDSSGVFQEYLKRFAWGVVYTLVILVFSVVVGLLLAIPVGLVQVTGPRWLASIARGYCSVMRGTPLLIQLWLAYYGLGEFLPTDPARHLECATWFRRHPRRLPAFRLALRADGVHPQLRRLRGRSDARRLRLGAEG